MHAVVRNYSGKGSKKLIDVIEKNKTEVEGLLRAINGFVSYYLVRTVSWRVFGVRLPGQGRHRREHSGGAGLDQ